MRLPRKQKSAQKYACTEGQHKNILAVITQPVFDLTRLSYEASGENTWLDLENKTPLSLRNIKLRLLNEDNSTVISRGLSLATILFKKSNE